MKPILHKIVQGVLFTVCAIPGLVFILVAPLELYAYFDPYSSHRTIISHPAVAISVFVVGLFLVLVGVGKWKQWRYLFVFLAIPVSMWVVHLMPFFWGKIFPVVFIGFTTFLTYYLVRATEKSTANKRSDGIGTDALNHTTVTFGAIGMTGTQQLRFRFVMLATALTSATMTWGIVLYGFLTHPVRAYYIFSSVDPSWSIAAFTLAGVGVALAVVSLIRRDPAGIIGLVCSLAVLSGIWRLVPVV